MRTTRKKYGSTHEVPLRGRRKRTDAANSLQFFARIEGEPEHDGTHIRGANGMRWRVA